MQTWRHERQRRPPPAAVAEAPLPGCFRVQPQSSQLQRRHALQVRPVQCLLLGSSTRRVRPLPPPQAKLETKNMAANIRGSANMLLRPRQLESKPAQRPRRPQSASTRQKREQVLLLRVSQEAKRKLHLPQRQLR
jgi:hypothetical protein